MHFKMMKEFSDMIIIYGGRLLLKSVRREYEERVLAKHCVSLKECFATIHYYCFPVAQPNAK